MERPQPNWVAGALLYPMCSPLSARVLFIRIYRVRAVEAIGKMLV